MKTGLRLLLGLRSEAEVIERATGLEHISLIRPHDVILSGYPKSGNTWLQYMLAELQYGIDASRARDEVIQDLVPSLDAKFGDYYRRYSGTMIFRSHAFPLPSFRRVIYLCRDGRDVLASYLEYLKLWPEHKNVDAVALIEGRYRGIPSWEEHMRAWLENPYGAEKCDVKYEDLIERPGRELEKIARFAGLEVTPGRIDATVEHCNFEAMKQREKAHGWSAQNSGFPAGGGFIRKGEVGSHEEDLPEEVLEFFVRRAGPILKLRGYL